MNNAERSSLASGEIFGLVVPLQKVFGHCSRREASDAISPERLRLTHSPFSQACSLCEDGVDKSDE